MEVITKRKARRIALAAQQILNKQPFGRGQNAVLKTIKHLGYVQIDTISVIIRAHHHVLWNRVENYDPKFLVELTKPSKSIFEYWSHALSYLPIEDFRFTFPLKKYYAAQKDPWPKVDNITKKQVYNRIVQEGPLMARDFEQDRSGKGSGWFDWKPAKRSLERLFMEGKLMVARREGFQKVYDIPERVLPPDTNITPPSKKEYAQFLIKRNLQAHGIVTAEEICYLRKGIKKIVQAELLENQKEMDIIPVRVQGLDNRLYFTKEAHLNSIQRTNKTLKILSPFDNLVIQRKRLKHLFDFDYFIECYVPPQKRVYGYFCLPILFGDKFLGRLDAKADRKSKMLIIKSLHLDPSLKRETFPEQAYKNTLEKFAFLNGCETIQYH